METRAPYVAVGAFLLIMMVCLGGFVAWLVGFRAEEPNRYHIYFDGTVTGLTEGSPVQMRGIPVGRVDRIEIDPADLERVRVTIEVKPSTPVKQNTKARLDRAGITGGVFVQLFGSTSESPALHAERGQFLPVIQSEASKLEQLFEGAPDMVANATQLMARAQALLSDRNLQSVENLLANAERTMASFRTSAEQIDTMTGDIRQLVSNLNSITANFDQNIDRVRDDALATLETFRGSAARFEAMATEFERMAAENRPGLKQFSENGLYELTLMMNETRTLIGSLSRIADQFERDPARFLFGDAQRGYQPR